MMQIRISLVALMAIAASACSHMPSIDLPMGANEAAVEPSAVEPVAEGTVVATQELSATNPLQRAIKLLDAGDPQGARIELDLTLETSPTNKTALSLLRQIETDPILLLGEANEPYIVLQGDTLSELAGRHLGDPLLFYALSRYNDLRSPQALEVGKTLRMPVSEAAADSEHFAAGSTTSVAAIASRSLTAAQSEEAKMLRRRGLEALNAGQTDAAVQLLEAAYRIDGANGPLSKDLARAKTIQQAVKRP